MAIEVGDAVLRFLGDSSQLDTKFDEVGPSAKAAFEPAAEAAEEAGERMKFSMSEARGEVRLLGEEVGVRLPRHVGNFVASLPGVGEALSAAFSATAVLFLAQALVQLTEKASSFIADRLIFTQAMKDSNEATVESNKLLLEQAANYDKAKEALDKFGASGTDSMRLQLAALREQLATQKEALPLAEQAQQAGRSLTGEYRSQHGWLSRGYDVLKSVVLGTKNQFDTLRDIQIQQNLAVTSDAAKLKALQEEEALLEKQLETQHRLETIRQGGETQSAAARLKAAQRAAEVAEDSGTADARKKIAQQLEDELYQIKRNGMQQQLAILKETDGNTKDAQVKLLGEMKAAADAQATVVVERLTKEKDEVFKILQEVSVTGRGFTLPPIITVGNLTNLQKGRDAAHNLGVTLREDLVKGFNDAIKAQHDFEASGLRDDVALKAIVDNVHKAKTALDQFGKSEDTFKLKSHGMWNEFREEAKTGATALDLVKASGVQAFDDLSKNIEGAFQSIVLGTGNVVQALEKATAASLSQIASQAAVKAIFYTGEGLAALAGFNDGSAASFFAAAGEMAAVAVAAGAAGRALSGAGGSSATNTQQSNNSRSNTSNQAGRSGGSLVGVQHFADGGLISGPTLAVMGENNRKEAVLPLEDKRAMASIGEAIGQGGGNIHVHVAGLISPDNLNKVINQINKRVNRGQSTLMSSNTLRVTKRSA